MTREEKLQFMAAILIGPWLASKHPVTGNAPSNAALMAVVIEDAVQQVLEEELQFGHKAYLKRWTKRNRDAEDAA